MTIKKPKIRVYKDGEMTDKEKQQILEFKSDRLRRRYDLRYVDTDKVNNIFLKAHIIKLKKRTEEGKLETGMKETFG